MHVVLWLILFSCKERLGFEAVSIKPTYAWEDGCAAVKISGHGFQGDVSATIGGEPVTEVVPAEGELDRGYFFTAVAPPGEPGMADVVVTSGGEESRIEQGFYYVACFGSPYPELLSPDAAAPGETVTITGCNLDAATYTVDFRDEAGVAVGATAALAAGCGEASASFTVPEGLPEGTYHLYFLDSGGADAFPSASCDYATDTASPCETPPALTVGGA